MHAPNRHATQNMITKYIEQVFPFHGKPESRSVTKTCIHNQLKSSKAFVVASKNASGDVFYGISPEYSLANLEGTKLPTMVVMPPKSQQQVWPITILRSVTYIWIPVQRAGFILSLLCHLSWGHLCCKVVQKMLRFRKDKEAVLKITPNYVTYYKHCTRTSTKKHASCKSS